jgi:phosphotransferase family enzyme
MGDVAQLSPTREAIAAELRGFAQPPDFLLALSEGERVAAALARHVPELATGELTLAEIEVEKVRIKESSRLALYRVAVVEAGGAGEQGLLLRGELLPPGLPVPRAGSNGAGLGREGWKCYLPELRLELVVEPEDDRALPALRVLTDPVAARDVLERALRQSSPRYAGLRIESCRPRVMRYERGSRCTVLYELRYPPEGDSDGPDVLVAKTHRGSKGRTAYEAMQALWASVLPTSGAVALAEPLAFLPELNVLVQAGLPHELTLKQLIGSALAAESDDAREELSAYISKTAVGLAALHTSGVHAADKVTWEDELAEIHEVVERLATLAPAVQEAAGPLLASVGALADEHPADPLVSAHRSFRPAQVLLNGGEIAFIDFDGCCQAEPALDLALFCATLKDIGLEALRGRPDGEAPESLSRHMVTLDGLRELFLTCYETTVPVSRTRVALWEALDLMTAVLHSWTKAKFDRLEPRLQLLRHHLRAGELSGGGT